MSMLFQKIPPKTDAQVQEERNERVRFNRPCTRCGTMFKTTKYGQVCENCKGQTYFKKLIKNRKK